MQIKYVKWQYCWIFLLIFFIRTVAGHGSVTITLKEIKYTAKCRDETQKNILESLSNFTSCPVCLEDYQVIINKNEQECVIVTCEGHHPICSGCAKEIETNEHYYSCPICRSQLDYSIVNLIKDDEPSDKFAVFKTANEIRHYVMMQSQNLPKLSCSVCQDKVNVSAAFNGTHLCSAAMKKRPPPEGHTQKAAAYQPAPEAMESADQYTGMKPCSRKRPYPHKKLCSRKKLKPPHLANPPAEFAGFARHSEATNHLEEHSPRMTLQLHDVQTHDRHTSAGKGMFDQLHTFLSPEDKATLILTTANPQYRNKFSLLSYKECPPMLHVREDVDVTGVCNTLYYGLIHGLLSEDEFMECYHTLMIHLFFFPERLPEPPLNTATTMAKDISIITWHDIPSELKKYGFVSVSRDIFNGRSKWFDYYFKIEFTEEFANRCKEERFSCNEERDCSNFETAHFINWFYIFEDNIPGIYFDKENGKTLYIPSFSLQRELLKYISYGKEESVSMKPVFGLCDWEQLKSMRFKNQHPIALWHPLIKDSLLQPDGYWLGVLSYMHDIYHVTKLNQVPLYKRLQRLHYDTAFNTPIVSFLERIIKNNAVADKNLVQDTTDRLFIDGLEQQFSEISSTLVCDEMSEHLSQPYPWGLPESVEASYSRYNEKFSVPASLEMTTTTYYRRFLDQEATDDKVYNEDFKNHTHFNMFKPIPYCRSLTSRLAYNMMVFQSVIHKADSEDYRFHACDIKEYPKERNTLNEMGASRECRLKLESFCKDYPDAVDRWHIDWWVRYLADKDISSYK